MIHEASAAERQAKLREVYASLAKTPKGRLTGKSLEIWHSYCDGFNISPERARQIMKAPDIPEPEVAKDRHLQARIKAAITLLRKHGYSVALDIP